jgi:hypothetical protein
MKTQNNFSEAVYDCNQFYTSVKLDNILLLKYIYKV